MTLKPILKLASAAILLGALGTANANSISLAPGSIDAADGDFVSFDIIMDFSSTTIGGGFDVNYSSADLAFVDWVAAGVGDPGFAREPDLLDGVLSGIAVGEFNTGITGVQNIGTVTFQVIGGSSSVFLSDTSSPAGPFVDFNTFQVIVPDYGSADVTVDAVIPVPAAVWLMVGGLGALFGFGRKRA